MPPHRMTAMIGQSGWPVTSVSWLRLEEGGGAAPSQSLLSTPRTPAEEKEVEREEDGKMTI